MEELTAVILTSVGEYEIVVLTSQEAALWPEGVSAMEFIYGPTLKGLSKAPAIPGLPSRVMDLQTFTEFAMSYPCEFSFEEGVSH